jgi:DNA-binding transcriptional ArsR family regulator
MLASMSDVVFHPPVQELVLTKVLAALAEPARLAIVRAIARTGETGVSCTQIQQDAGIEIGKSTMSHHQRVLRESGVTRTRIEGSRRMLTLRRTDLDRRFPGLLDAVLTESDTVIGAATG